MELFSIRIQRTFQLVSTHYEAEHLLSLDDAIQDLTQVCLNNGGGIQ